jgi:hypothetical protein
MGCAVALLQVVAFNQSYALWRSGLSQVSKDSKCRTDLLAVGGMLGFGVHSCDSDLPQPRHQLRNRINIQRIFRFRQIQL